MIAARKLALAITAMLAAGAARGLAQAPPQPTPAEEKASVAEAERQIRENQLVPALRKEALEQEKGAVNFLNPPRPTPSSATLTASRLFGRPLYDMQQHRLGTVHDLLIDPAKGELVAIVIATRAWLGLPGKEVALPREAVRADGPHRLVTSMSEAAFDAAPAFSSR